MIRKKMDKLKFSYELLSTLLKVSRRVNLAIKYQMNVVNNLYTLLCLVFPEGAPLPYMYMYIQATILNLLNSYFKKYVFYHTS